MANADFASITNADHLDQLYQQWQADPASVGGDWQHFFAGFALALERGPSGDAGGPTDDHKPGRIDQQRLPIWSVALALCAAAVLWMSALIVLRVFSDRAARRRAEDRRAVERCFVGILQGRSDVVRDLSPYRGRARLMAESLLDFLTLVRGVDLEIVLAALESVGVDKVLAARLNRGSLAGRLASVEALGAFPGEATRAALVQAAARGPATVRLAALRSLLQAGGEVDIARLLQHLARGELRHSGPLTDLAHLVIAADPTAAMNVLAQPDLAPATRILIVEGLGAAGAYAARTSARPASA